MFLSSYFKSQIFHRISTYLIHEVVDELGFVNRIPQFQCINLIAIKVQVYFQSIEWLSFFALLWFFGIQYD